MSRSISINGSVVNDNSDCYIIAEIGHNHQGDVEKAKKLFRAAKECGVNAVKLQKRDNRSLYTHELYNAPYDHESSFGSTYGEHREALEFGKNEYLELKNYAKEIDITMFATAFDIFSADFLAGLDMPAYKIASGDLKNVPLLKHVAEIGKPIILSTGGGTLEDVKRAYYSIMPINTQLCIMQCTAAYPAQPDVLNLRVISTYRKQFPDVVVGLSDHENGIDLATVAFMLGARVLEKHFTMNHTWKGTDHAFSLEPIGLKKLVRNLRRIPESLGDGIKRELEIEKAPLKKMGKSIVAAKSLSIGHLLKTEDIAFKSPAGGMCPYEFEKLIGKSLKQPVEEDQFLMMEMIE